VNLFKTNADTALTLAAVIFLVGLVTPYGPLTQLLFGGAYLFIATSLICNSIEKSKENT